jgi:hypothetical protein
MRKITHLAVASIVFSAAHLRAAPPEGKPVHSNINEVQNERDRGAGRIVDPQTHELDRLQDNRREFEQLNDERDRQLRIEAQQRQQQGGAPPAPGALPGPTTAQSNLEDVYGSDMQVFVAQTDRQLAAARQDYDRALEMELRNFELALRNASRESDPKKSDALRAAGEQKFNEEKSRIESDFERRKMKILGWPTTEPSTTMPTTAPSR